jgi:hypothetical protein
VRGPMGSGGGGGEVGLLPKLRALRNDLRRDFDGGLAGVGEDWNAKEVVGWRRRSARAEIRSAGKGGGVERLSRVRARWNHSWRRSGHCLPAAIVLLVEESGWIDEGGSDGLVGLVRDLLGRRTSEGNGLSFGEGMGRVCRGVNRC